MPIEDMVSFVEIDGLGLARKLGIGADDQIVVVSNVNRYDGAQIKESNMFKLINLDLQKTEPCKDILNSELLQSLGDDFLTEFSPEEVVQQLILGDNEDLNCYEKFCSFIESAMVPAEGQPDLIFAPSTRAVQFYRNYFRKQHADVLFVGVDDPEDLANLLTQFKEVNPDQDEDSIAQAALEKLKLAQSEALNTLIAQLKELRRDISRQSG